MSGFTVMECKKLCMFRCLIAVALSIGMQFLLLTVFLLFVNFHILHPVDWITSTFALMFSLYTWLSIIPLISAVIIYGILLGKSYLSVKKHYSSRFKWILGNVFKKLAFLLSHVLVGFLTAWLYASFLHVDYRTFFSECHGSQCINGRYTFIIYAGIVASCIYFVKEHLRQEPEVEFPIIQEKKVVQIRSLLYTTIYESLIKSFIPTMGFAFAFWLIGRLVNQRFARLFDVEVDDGLVTLFSIAANFRLIFYSWILSSQILSNMHLIQRFLYVILSTEMNFPIEKNLVLAESNAEVTLVEALALTQVPLIQKLAALDLYNISQNKLPKKRSEIFRLSVPGGHPYNWNQLSCTSMSLINAFTEELAYSVKNISAMKPTPLFAIIKPNATDTAEKILLQQYNETFCIRRLIAEQQPSNAAPSSLQKKSSNTYQRVNDAFEQFLRQLEESCRTAFRTIPGLFYLFGEPDGANTIFLLSNSQTIVWLSQGLAGICAASLLEDKYGVVQNTLPEVIKTLLKLKMELDKLNNVNLNGTKLDRNFITLKGAVKRSLYRICTVFGEYMPDLIDDAEDLSRLTNFLNYQET